MRDIAENLDVREQGEISEQWYQQRYGNRTDALSKQKINNSTQVILKTKDAEDNYGIKLSNKKHRKFDEVYGDENSATIREHKHIKGNVDTDQYRDNIQIVRHNREIDTKIAQGYTLTKSKDDTPIILEKDGKKYRPKKLVYTFATPEGVKTNSNWMKRELRTHERYLSFEIINTNGQRKKINSKNTKDLNDPALSK